MNWMFLLPALSPMTVSACICPLVIVACREDLVEELTCEVSLLNDKGAAAKFPSSWVACEYWRLVKAPPS